MRLQELADAALGSCRLFTRDEQAVVRAAYGALAQGLPVPPEQIAGAAGLPTDVVWSTFSRWPGLARLDQSGRVIACLGLSLEHTVHRLEVDGRTLYTWCAWDSLFIPRLLGATAAVASRCPITGAPVRLVVAPDGVIEVTPNDTTVSFLISCTLAGRPTVGACCPHIRFLSSPQAADRWLGDHPAGLVLGMGDAWELGRMFVDSRLSGANAGAATEPS